MDLNKLDKWLTGGNGHKTIQEVECKNGHKWDIPGYIEYGYFESTIEEDNWCPVCKELATFFE